MRRFTKLLLAVAAGSSLILECGLTEARAGLFGRRLQRQDAEVSAETVYPEEAAGLYRRGASYPRLQSAQGAYVTTEAGAPLVNVRHLEGTTAGFMALHDPSCCAPAVRKPCCPPPPIKQVLTFCHPCTCCNVCVEVCLPGCCVGCPKVCFRKHTLLGCGMYTYEWPCGHVAKIRFWKNGGVSVRQHD
ncbi:MAG: hypothetical protein N2C14_10150 [Planctomycetales bacterium]